MTYFTVRVAAVVVALGLVWIPSSAEAESQAGGLPEVSSRVQVLEQVSQALQSQVTTLLTEAKALQTQVDKLQSDNATLQQSLSKETETRKTETSGLQEAISQETQKRQTETAGLQEAIAQETQKRQTETAGLKESLSQETHTRQTADDALSQSAAKLEAQLNAAGKVFSVSVPQTFLVNGHYATVATLANVPAGRYVVIAKAVVENEIHDSGWVCLLFRNDEHLTSDELDFSNVTTEPNGFRLTRSTVSMVAVATLVEPGSFRLDCQTEENGSDLFGVKIVAVSVQ